MNLLIMYNWIKVDFCSSYDILFDIKLEENNVYYDEIINII